MAQRFKVGDRVEVKAGVPGGSNRTPFFIRGKKGSVVYYHGQAGDPRDLSYGGTGEPKLPLYCVSFHMAHLYDDDPDFVHDRVLVDVLEDWLEPVAQRAVRGESIDRVEHELTYYERRGRGTTESTGPKRHHERGRVPQAGGGIRFPEEGLAPSDGISAVAICKGAVLGPMVALHPRMLKGADKKRARRKRRDRDETRRPAHPLGGP